MPSQCGLSSLCFSLPCRQAGKLRIKDGYEEAKAVRKL